MGWFCEMIHRQQNRFHRRAPQDDITIPQGSNLALLYLSGAVREHSRHMYDIYKLLDVVDLPQCLQI